MYILIIPEFWVSRAFKSEIPDQKVNINLEDCFEKLKQRKHSQAIERGFRGGGLDTTIQGGSSPTALSR